MLCRNLRNLFLFSTIIPIFPVTGQAASLTDIVIFGDSLSDNGNAAYIFQNFPQYIPAGLPAPAPPLYTAGRYTNGPDVTPGTAYRGTWVEQLATKLGFSDPTPGLPNFLDPSRPAGNNLAVAGAETNSGPVGVSSMVSAYISSQPAALSSTTLYVLFGGANDLFRASDPASAADAAVTSIFDDVADLYAAGARHFLVPNLPDLGTTPRAVQSGQVAALSAASSRYAVSWAAALADARDNGIDVTGVDLYDLYQQIMKDPGAFGLQNVTTPAQGLSNADDHLFWDILHPTTKGHSLIAGAAYDALNPVPEPSSILLIAVATTALVVRRQRANR